MVADLPYPILGAYFLNNFNLLVDVRETRETRGQFDVSTLARASFNNVLSPSFFIAATGNQFHRLLASFSELVDPTFKAVKAMYTTNRHITTHSPPFFLTATYGPGQAQQG